MKQATLTAIVQKATVVKSKNSTAKTFYNKSESLCEEAPEIVQEILHYDSNPRIWFDRDISFEVGGDLSADIVFLPTLVASRSHERLREDSRIKANRM